MIKCDNCDEPAKWTATACYPYRDAIHPKMACYPAPMARACSDHLVPMLADDMRHGGSTKSWVVKPVTV